MLERLARAPRSLISLIVTLIESAAQYKPCEAKSLHVARPYYLVSRQNGFRNIASPKLTQRVSGCAGLSNVSLRAASTV